MASGTLSKGITLSMNGAVLNDLQEIPELGGSQSSVEVTTLADDSRRYIAGLKDLGDSITFKFLFVEEQFLQLAAGGTGAEWVVKLPSGATCSFTGDYSAKLDSAGVEAALTYSLIISPSSSMVWAEA